LTLYRHQTDIIYTVLDLWTPWIAEAVLVVRIAAVFPRRKWPQLLAFPIAVKAARIVFTVIFFIRWGKMILRGLSNEYDILGTFRMEFKVLFCLELLDNTYVRSCLPLASFVSEQLKLRFIHFSLEAKSSASRQHLNCSP
jgi:hypothetical protein